MDHKLQVALAWNGDIHIWRGEHMPPAENLLTVNVTQADGGLFVIRAHDALPVRELLGVASERLVPAPFDAYLEHTLADAYSAVIDLIDVAFEAGDQERIGKLSILAQRLRRQIRMVESVELDDEQQKPPGM